MEGAEFDTIDGLRDGAIVVFAHAGECSGREAGRLFPSLCAYLVLSANVADGLTTLDSPFVDAYFGSKG